MTSESTEEGSSTWFVSSGILWNNSGTLAFFFLLLCFIGLSVVDGFFAAVAAAGGFLLAGSFPCGSSAFASFFFVFVVFGADDDNDALAFDAFADVDALAFDAFADVDASASVRGFVFLNCLPTPSFLPIVVVVVVQV